MCYVINWTRTQTTYRWFSKIKEKIESLLLHIPLIFPQENFINLLVIWKRIVYVPMPGNDVHVYMHIPNMKYVPLGVGIHIL